MAAIREEFVNAALNRAFALTDHNIHNTLEKKHEFRKQTILADESLTNDEKSHAIKLSTRAFDCYKILYNEGTKRICENCQDECLATLFCEHCFRNYLRANFSNWTSGNNDIDNLIQRCQMETIAPDTIVEWIPYNNLQNIKYLTKGGCSEIYTAVWIDGNYEEWDSKEKQLKRFGSRNVVLKKLENVGSANRNWFEEGKFHLTLGSKYGGQIMPCYGLTKDPSDGNYMLIMDKMDMDLRKYLQENHIKLTWKEGIQIVYNIIGALYRIHSENAIHRDLHSGNILFQQYHQRVWISDLGFCGPANKPLNSIYGNLPYIAPEVFVKKKTTFASDIYSFGMLMWEISSGQSPFAGFDHDYDLVMKIINGMRPKVVPGTPLKYKILMEQCWDADPTKRPDVDFLIVELQKLGRQYYLDENKDQINNSTNIYDSQLNTDFRTTSSLVRNFSKIHIFEDLPEPRNATEEEQEVYHSIQNDLSIPDNIETKQNVIIDNNNEVKNKSKRSNPVSDDEREDLAANSKKIKLNYDETVGFQYIQRNCIDSDDDDDETCNNPNLHSEDQDNLEIPEDMF